VAAQGDEKRAGPLSQEEDRALAQRAAADDIEAFTELVRRHEARVRSFLSRLCRSEEADDLAQEIFLKAWRRAGAYRGEGSYAGWLLRIAWREFLSRRRSQPEAAVAFEDDLHGGRTDADPGVQVDVDRALAALDPRERAAALLCLGQGYSHQEAAEILDLPLGTLKSITARARTKLANSLGGIPR
jgi:RNA polymerase sigma factor (sigma-70 family)